MVEKPEVETVEEKIRRIADGMDPDLEIIGKVIRDYEVWYLERRGRVLEAIFLHMKRKEAKVIKEDETTWQNLGVRALLDKTQAVPIDEAGLPPEFCPESSDGLHRIDPHSATAAPGVAGCVVDVACALCGRSGSAAVRLTDVQW